MGEREAVFVLTHERAGLQFTVEMLRRQGYTGEIILVVDTEDSQIDRYRKSVGENMYMHVFDKKEVKCDTYINDEYWASVLFARNESEKIAKEHGIESFAMLDDDIAAISERYVDGGKLKRRVAENLDEVFAGIWEICRCHGVQMMGIGSQNMYIGGKLNYKKRRCHGVIFRNSSKDVDWKSIMNEDYVTEIQQNRTCGYCAAFPELMMETKNTGKGVTEGGMKTTYQRLSPYARSFFAVMEDPALTKVDGKNRITRPEGGQPEVVSGRWKK